MSLVGPRPDKVDQISLYEPGEERRLAVKPGITGLAQISGRNDLPWSQRKRIDLDYVEQRSTWLDLAILAKTVPYVLLRRGVNQASRQAEEGRHGA
jgi:lipopolysaccharide/colanic/teichoic acid biosynthesis glycosyltransferase